MLLLPRRSIFKHCLLLQSLSLVIWREHERISNEGKLPSRSRLKTRPTTKPPSSTVDSHRPLIRLFITPSNHNLPSDTSSLYESFVEDVSLITSVKTRRDPHNSNKRCNSAVYKRLKDEATGAFLVQKNWNSVKYFELHWHSRKDSWTPTLIKYVSESQQNYQFKFHSY